MELVARTCPRCGVAVSAREAEARFDGACPKCLLSAMLDAPKADVPSVGSEFGDYVLLGVLGTGGMGIVYKARQKGLNRTVALKILPSQGAPAELVERFLREARMAAKLRHPNIVPIHEVDSHDGTYFYSMELVEGVTLSEYFRDRERASREALGLVEKIASAVHHAHENGVIHRDLKPTNVMIDKNGEPRILDFGIAKSLTTEGGATGTGNVLGTPPYMSPEQAAGSKDLDARADVYSLGAILYEILTGRPPHSGETVMEIFRKIATEEPSRPSKLNRAVPREVEAICLKALEKEKSARYATARELADDLRRHLDGRPIMARPAGLPRKAARWARRRATILGMTAALLIAIVGCGYFAMRWVNAEISAALAGTGIRVNRLVEKLNVDLGDAFALARVQMVLESARFGTGHAERAERRERLEEARASLDRTLETQGSTADRHYWRGRVHEALGGTEAAVADYTQALELSPDLDDARYRRVLIRVREWLLRAIQSWAFSSLPSGPLEKDLVFLEARSGQKERTILLRSVLEFAKACGILQNDPGFWSRPEEARILKIHEALDRGLDTSLKENPVYFDALLLKGMLVSPNPTKDTMAEVRSRRAFLDRALIVEPNDARCHGERAKVLWGLGECGAALEDEEAAVTLTGERGRERLRRAQYLWQMGLRSLAREDIDSSLRAFPKEPEPYYVRALLQTEEWGPPDRLPNRNQVIEDLDRAVSLEPKSGKARLLRAGVRKIYLEDGAGSKADLEAWKSDNLDHPWARFGWVEQLLRDQWGAWFVEIPFKPGDDRVRQGCVEYAKARCRDIERGADRTALIPRIAAMLERAFELGLDRLDADFDLVRQEPTVRAIVAKYDAYSRLTYKILWPKGEPSRKGQIPELLLQRLRARVQGVLPHDPLITLEEDGRVRVRMANVDRTGFDRIKERLRPAGKPTPNLEFRPVATRELHEEWRKTGTVPEGYAVVDCEQVLEGEYDHIRGKKILLLREPSVTGNDIAIAVAKEGSHEGWYLSAELTEEGARRFDRSTEVLHEQVPKGLIAILMEGRILSMPTVQAAKFGGSIWITGSLSKLEASALADALESGAGHVKIIGPLEEEFVGPRSK